MLSQANPELQAEAHWPAPVRLLAFGVIVSALQEVISVSLLRSIVRRRLTEVIAPRRQAGAAVLKQLATLCTTCSLGCIAGMRQPSATH
ncbi:hypothetical protein HaLaN_25547 [Haematococcus lacustris]|uniref:Uncharacterized protein n=1 Tax=Haematococcus lacustris TaxID=44745 RepID=A0A699ZX39_HAELA|nr:hypothetical protein HaLaN_25547 [Haematococcus lacustris]